MNRTASTPPIVDHDLARRLERAEGIANAVCVDARRTQSPQSGACWIEVAGTLAMFDGPDSPLTQTFGLGMFAEIRGQELDQLESFFRERGASVNHEICPLVDQTFLRSLSERGYRPIEWSNVMIRTMESSTDGDPAVTRQIPVRLIEPNERELWAQAAAKGWNQEAALADYILEMSRIVASREGSLCFLAELGGKPIATGGLFVHEGIALFAGASTIPEARGQGAQRALFAGRLHYAKEMGCDLAEVVTLPGSLSDRNAQKSGFRTAYTRTKWLLPHVASSDRN